MKRASISGPLAKSIIFVIVTGLATAILAFSIAGTGVGGTASYNATFTDVSGLNTGDSVRIAGVRVGQVEKISVTGRRLARVKFSVESDRRLPVSTTATIKYLNLVGQRYIELDRGTGPINAGLPRGSTIPLDHTTPALNLTQLFNGFQPLFEALSPNDVNQLSGEIIQVLQGENTNVDSLVASVASLTTTLAAKDKVIGRVIDNLTTVVNTINARADNFNELIRVLRQLVHGFAQDSKPILQAVGAIGQLTTATSGLLQPARDPLKQDIRQLGRLSGNLNDDHRLVDTFLQRLPYKMRDITRIASYGSWLNFYQCEASISGVKVDGPGDPPTGIPITDSRCR